MFRTAVLRATRAAARPAARRALLTSAPAAPRVGAVFVPKIQSIAVVRMYSAGGALAKDQVEGRIMSLLQGFDKVSLISTRQKSSRELPDQADGDGFYWSSLELGSGVPPHSCSPMPSSADF